MKATTHKFVIVLLCMLLYCGHVEAICTNSIVYTSVRHGNFNAASTWSPVGVPTGCDTVIINHSLSLPPNLNFGSDGNGYIEVRPNGAITGMSQNITLFGSVTFVNNGRIIINNFSVNGPETKVINNGSFNVRSLTNLNQNSELINNSQLYLDNNFNIQGATFKNETGSTLILRGDLTQNVMPGETVGATIINKGLFSGWLNLNLIKGTLQNTSSGMFFVNGNMELTGDNYNQVSNAGFISVGQNLINNAGASFTNSLNLVVNQDFQNMSGFKNMTGSITSISGNLYNLHYPEAYIQNDGGHIEIFSDFINSSLILGDFGSFSINSHSENDANGVVQGFQDVCDKTSATGGGFDVNSGKVGPYVTYCRIIVPLPVSWLSFNAAKSEENVILEWATATESNSSYYIVERAIEGGEFKSIGEVKAAGNSVSIKTYKFIDANPIIGTSYYRLKQVDTDGTFSFSKMVSIRMDERPFTATIFPNPVAAGQDLTVEIRGCKADQVQVSIRNMIGQEIVNRLLHPHEISGQIQLPANLFSKGIYLMQVSDNSNKQSALQKIIVQ